jgi:apolipoprotein N-acyltransferase
VGALAYGIPFGFVAVAPVAHAPLIFVAGVGILAVSTAAMGGLLAASHRVSRVAPLLLAPLVWAGIEVARSHPTIGLPWLHLSHALVDQPILALGVREVGGPGLSAGIVAINVALAAALQGRWPLLAVGLLGLFPLGVSLALDPGVAARYETTEPRADQAEGPAIGRVRVAAAQPHFPPRASERRAAHQSGLDRLVGLSQRAVSQRADLIVWPETAYEREVPPEGDAFLGVLARSLGVPLLVGARRRTLPGATRNAVILAESSGETRPATDKVHPLPLVERAPNGIVANELARRGLWLGSHEAGDPPRIVEVPVQGGRITLGVLVCADLGHPDLGRTLRSQGAGVLIHVTDESGLEGWAGALHARMARLRALELGVPIVRVANGGPSLWIGADAEILAAVPSGGPAVATHEIRPAAAPGRLPASESQVMTSLLFGTGGPVVFLAVRSRKVRFNQPKEMSR